MMRPALLYSVHYSIHCRRLAMAIQFPLPVGTIVLCDYAMGGFRPPEMVKRRPAIIVSPRLPHRDGLCTIVPLSGTAPERDVPYVVRVEFTQPLPYPFPHAVFWAKCDMLATVGFGRLDMFHTERDQTGKRKYLRPQLAAEQLAAVRRGVLSALGIAGAP
jgi:uncharacterized protein YifN (PemK superfamily)